VRSTTSCSLFLRAGCDELHATQTARMTDRGAESLRAKLITALITKERSAFSRRPLPTVMTSEGGWRYCRPRCLACARERRGRRLSPATSPTVRTIARGRVPSRAGARPGFARDAARLCRLGSSLS
jgi:hypothetical protein